MTLLDAVKFDNSGLVPAIAQDYKSGEILMMAYMNRESLQRTMAEKKACYWSRSRKKYWVKGETSGHIQEIREILIDCDGDTILLKVNQLGPGACHTGFRSCFYRHAADNGNLEEVLSKVFDEKTVYNNK